MSMLLDQTLVEDVARYCPEKFLDYHRCMAAGDSAKCLNEQVALTECVKTQVPSFVKIVQDCGDKLKAYENCLRENIKDRSVCAPQLKSMRECSEKAISLAKDEKKVN
ncbi:hypothetical protein NADFUDRAFT_51323 [Nadsonia fulvescens var. elongata DSM 6958]|uniref:IMS import disulfide relay-system CHCH-CHCH-like Cx9C domain-containing protein n=1 Tax=Nadsonia fulvescens var. elongata DSM 6958 TaxID=857566 RepID=A0A1E3PKT4_9ASCO|nr:hypothetical protein NADFUDRAFT_51323 [Nadsonia fulvescens var. elongata DSM 6958]